MIRIGDFARIGQVSVKTLRYYDEMGLLKPVLVDRFTGYRYYAVEQLASLNRILALKDMGFSLNEIERLLGQEIPVAEIRGMLRLKQVELNRQVEQETAKLDRVEARLKILEKEGSMPEYEIVIKRIEPMLVAGVRQIIPAYSQQGQLWNDLEDYLRMVPNFSPKGPCFTLFHSDEPEIDAEACEQLNAPVPAGRNVQVHSLPAVEIAACAVHHGPFETLHEAYEALIRWIEMNGYRISGPPRDVYLKEPERIGSQTDPDPVTEVQIPIRKV